MLGEKQEDGQTLREHLQSVFRQTGNKPEQLKSDTELISAFSYLWEWYKELHGARSNSGYGSSPISFVEIQAWAELTCQYPTSWDVKILKELDRIHLGFLNKARK